MNTSDFLTRHWFKIPYVWSGDEHRWEKGGRLYIPPSDYPVYQISGEMKLYNEVKSNGESGWYLKDFSDLGEGCEAAISYFAIYTNIGVCFKDMDIRFVGLPINNLFYPKTMDCYNTLEELYDVFSFDSDHEVVNEIVREMTDPRRRIIDALDGISPTDRSSSYSEVLDYLVRLEEVSDNLINIENAVQTAADSGLPITYEFQEKYTKKFRNSMRKEFEDQVLDMADMKANLKNRLTARWNKKITSIERENPGVEKYNNLVASNRKDKKTMALIDQLYEKFEAEIEAVEVLLGRLDLLDRNDLSVYNVEKLEKKLVKSASEGERLKISEQLDLARIIEPMYEKSRTEEIKKSQAIELAEKMEDSNLGYIFLDVYPEDDDVGSDNDGNMEFVVRDDDDLGYEDEEARDAEQGAMSRVGGGSKVAYESSSDDDSEEISEEDSLSVSFDEDLSDSEDELEFDSDGDDAESDSDE